MLDPEEIYNKLILLLDKNHVEYRLFNHRPALTYDDLEEVSRETGFFGTEGKCMVLKADEKFVVYFTLQGRRLNFDSIKEFLGVKKLRLASTEELKEYFGAQPGCAYPFGFDEKYDIYVDPAIFDQEWLLFSPVFPTKTIQAKACDLRKVFSNLNNSFQEISTFNDSGNL